MIEKIKLCSQGVWRRKSAGTSGSTRRLTLNTVLTMATSLPKVTTAVTSVVHRTDATPIRFLTNPHCTLKSESSHIYLLSIHCIRKLKHECNTTIKKTSAVLQIDVTRQKRLLCVLGTGIFDKKAILIIFEDIYTLFSCASSLCQVVFDIKMTLRAFYNQIIIRMRLYFLDVFTTVIYMYM